MKALSKKLTSKAIVSTPNEEITHASLVPFRDACTVLKLHQEELRLLSVKENFFQYEIGGYIYFSKNEINSYVKLQRNAIFIAEDK